MSGLLVSLLNVVIVLTAIVLTLVIGAKRHGVRYALGLLGLGMTVYAIEIAHVE